MKKVFLVLLGLVAGTASFANETLPQNAIAQARVVMTPQDKIKIFVQPLQTKGQLSIEDARGQSIYQRTVALQKGFSQQLDFSSLRSGTYHLTLTTGKETISKTFVVQPLPHQSFVVQ